MRSVALLLFGVHLAFAYKYDFSITCVDVTGSVGEKLTLTCRDSDLNNRCCIKSYKFIQIASDGPPICRVEFSKDHCEQMDSFSCSYTAEAAMTTPFQFFLQTNCGQMDPVFTVNVTEENHGSSAGQGHGEEVVTDFSIVIVTAGCVLPLIIVAAIIGVIVWTRSSQVKRHLKGYLRGSTTDTDSVSDQQMQRYASSVSMNLPQNF